MPRGIPTFNSGTIATGSTALDDFILLIRDQITSYQSNGQQAWEIYTGSINLPYTGSVQNTRETWFHSVGDRSLGSGDNQGDTDIWVRLHQVGSIAALSGVIGISVFQDYSPVSNVGYNFNVTSSSTIPISLINGIVWYAVFNEYEFSMIFRSANRWNSFSFGKLMSRSNQKFLGTARLSQQVSGTGTVVFPLDRDIRGTGSTPEVQIGQSVWVVNQGYSNAAADTPARFEIGKVADVSSNTITLSEMTSSGVWRSGSLVGLESQNVYSFVQSNAGTPTCHLLFNQDFYNNNVAAAVNSDTNQTNFGNAEGPSLDLFYKGSRVYVSAQISFDGAYRGYLQHLIQVSTGTLANGSRITRDIYGPPFVEENSWLIFPSVRVASGISSKCFALGPYARDFSGL